MSRLCSVRAVGIAVVVAALMFSPTQILAQSGGGSVNNKASTAETFTNTGASLNSGATDVFSGTVKDRNGEADLVQIQVATTSGPVVTATRSLTADDLSATSEPGSFASGWKVWNPTANDGVLSFKFQHTYSSAATYVWRLSVKDEGSFANGPAADITVNVVQAITVAADPVDSTGAAVSGARWGAWTADPGATNIEAGNFLKITNSGAVAAQPVTIDFSSASFAGVTTATQAIGIDNNIQFAFVEVDGGTAPSSGVFTYGSTSASGSVSLAFSATGKVIFVKYKVLALPETLLDQDYSASYTVSPV